MPRAVSIAGELTAHLVVLHARESPQGYPKVGPPSVGHTARFVVDHSPTTRSLAPREQLVNSVDSVAADSFANYLLLVCDIPVA